MAKPQLLQKLTHDKLLTKTNFPQFVETYNYTVNRCENIKGDGDEYGQGLIQVDNTDPEHPIIRVNYDNLKSEYLEQTTPDADISAEKYQKFYEVSGLSSIQTRWENPGEDNELKSLQLYQFDLSNSITIQLSDENNPSTPEGEEEQLSSGYDFIVRKDGKVQYAKLSAHAYPVDSSISSANISSLQTRDIEDGPKVLQLYKFNEASNLKNQVQLSTEMSSLLPEHYEFLVRKTDNDKMTLEYMSISAACLEGGGGGEGLPPDTDTPNAETSSIQSREVGSDKVLELYDFHNTNNVESIYLSSQSRYDFLMRDQQTHQLKYTHLSVIEDVTLSGTDNSSHTGSAFKFQSADDSNIIVNVDANGNITIGCYYL